MIGDWVFFGFLVIIFIIEIIAGVIIINSASGLTPTMRKSDSGLKKAYDEFNIAGQLSLYNGIIALVIICIPMILLFVPPVMRKSDMVPRYAKIIVKSIFGVIVIGITLLVAFYLYQAVNSIINSRTYGFSRLGAKKAFDASIKSTKMAANFYILLAIVLVILFTTLGIYDGLGKSKLVKNTNEDTVGKSRLVKNTPDDNYNEIEYNIDAEVAKTKLVKKSTVIDDEVDKTKLVKKSTIISDTDKTKLVKPSTETTGKNKLTADSIYLDDDYSTPS